MARIVVGRTSETTGAVARIRVDNPARRNAMTYEMWRDLASAVDRLGHDPAVRVVVVEGAGGHFVSGADISEFEARRGTAEAVAAYNAAVDAATAALASCPKPTLARITGVCIGGGLGIAMACDLRLAAGDARFAIPAARLGIAYPLEDVRRLVELVGPAAATDILCTGRTLGAAEALALGLVNRVAAADDLDRMVEETAGALAANAPLSIAASRAAVRAMLPGATAADRAAAELAAERCAASADYAEGRRAFMEKRPPRFQGH